MPLLLHPSPYPAADLPAPSPHRPQTAVRFKSSRAHRLPFRPLILSQLVPTKSGKGACVLVVPAEAGTHPAARRRLPAPPTPAPPS
jgi:hypothetical protein